MNGTLVDDGSLLTVGTLQSIGSLSAHGTRMVHGSLTYYGTLISIGSLGCHGTLRRHSARSWINGTLVNLDSLPNVGTLTHYRLARNFRYSLGLRLAHYYGTFCDFGSSRFHDPLFAQRFRQAGDKVEIRRHYLVRMA